MSIDKEVETYLKSRNINFSVKLVAENMTDGEWRHDKWLAIIDNETFDYRTGLGFRTNRIVKPCIQARDNVTGIRGLYSIENQYIRVPPIASVLYSLLLDAEADDMSFNDWCDNMGMDNDSMRTLSIYQACCEIARKLYTIFSRSELAHLRELLQDY